MLVVDDHLMGVTHVVRAEEWISSTALHIQLYGAKVVPEIAAARRVPEYENCYSPNAHSQFSDPDGLIDFVEAIAQRGGGGATQSQDGQHVDLNVDRDQTESHDEA